MKEKFDQFMGSRWGDPVRLVQFLGRLLADERVPRSAKLKLAGAGLYAVVPIDLIPDPIKLVPGLGYMDDFILVVHGIKCLLAETEPAVAAELWPGDEESFRRSMTAVKKLDDALFETIRNGLRGLFSKVGKQTQPDR